MIEHMTHVAVLCKTADRDALLRWLYHERGFHVKPVEDENDSWTAQFAPMPDESQAKDVVLNRINSVVGFCQEHTSSKPSFLDAMLPLKVMGTKEDVERAVAETDVDGLNEQSSELRSALEAQNETITRLKNQMASVEQFAFLGDDLPRLRHLNNIILEVVAVSGQGGKAFLLDERIVDGPVVAEELVADQTHTYYALVVPKSQEEILRSLIDDHGLHIHPLPEIDRGATEEIADLRRAIAQAEEALAKKRGEASAFADQWLRKASLAAGYYESEKNLAVARNGMAESSHLFVARGYVRTADLPLFEQRLAKALPGATVEAFDAPEGEEPPVSLKWNKWISPASLLVKMYGLPSYYGIDPTPYVASIFFLFVGICLGDAVYGLALILIMQWLKKKYREQTGLQDFFQCFVYCGVVAIVVGILTGSFAGDLSSMVPGFGWFDAIRTRMAVIDPIKDSQTALYIAIGLGILTQFYGMALRVYRDWRRGDKMGAFSDGILWMCFLLFAIIAGFTGSTLAVILLIASAIGLILTQGREQTGWGGRIVVGIISLYGIVGAYGASAILGDLISYARLMALSLTSAALGSTFNMLAELSVGIAYVGVIVAVFVVVFGHLMNFFLGLLGGFVHSARLIMLEFFGRFYEAGGSEFKPYGFDSSTVGLKEDEQG